MTRDIRRGRALMRVAIASAIALIPITTAAAPAFAEPQALTPTGEVEVVHGHHGWGGGNRGGGNWGGGWGGGNWGGGPGGFLPSGSAF
jgi:hypothetical protein